MKLSVSSLYYRPDVVSAPARARWEVEATEVVTPDRTIVVPRSPASTSRSMHFVILLAFGQSLLFLVLWLFMCASAGAADEAQPESKPEKPALRASAYAPEGVRDPFVPPGTKLSGAAVVAVGADEFKLQGILWHPTKPSAIINGKLVELNRPATIATVVGEVEAVAVEITRDLVKLKLDEEVIELHLGLPKPKPAQPERLNPATSNLL